MGTYKVMHGKDGRWTSLRRYIIKQLLMWGTIAFLFWFFIWGHPMVIDALDKEITAVNVVEAAVVTPATLEEMKGDVLDRLKQCENKEGVAIIFDTNGKASIGDYMWQIGSFQHYWSLKTGQKLTQKQAASYALDDVKARELASWVIFETKSGVDKDWVNCSKRHSLQTLVDFIGAHSK